MAKKRMSRNDKIQAVVDSMANWDQEELLKWAQTARTSFLRDLSANDLDAEYKSSCDPG